MPIWPPRGLASRERTCKAAAEVCKSALSRHFWCERATGRRASGRVKVTRKEGTGRRSARGVSRHLVAASFWHVGPWRCLQAC